MAIILLAFLPVFALTGQEGKLFHPLAFTKPVPWRGDAALCHARAGPVHALAGWEDARRGRQPGHASPGLALSSAAALGLATPGAHHRGRGPGVRWRSVPGAAHRAGVYAAAERGGLDVHARHGPGHLRPQAIAIVQKQTAIQQFREVDTVVAKIARADTSTDPAPLNMTGTSST